MTAHEKTAVDGWKTSLSLTLVLVLLGGIMALFVNPPCVFVGLGLIIAVKNWLDIKYKIQLNQKPINTSSGSKRVRTTGHIS